MMISKLYHYRFIIFLISQAAVLFGSLIIPGVLFEKMSPVFFQLNILAGILVISKRKKLMWFFITLLTIAFFIFGLSLFERSAELRPLDTYRLPIYFLFYFTVSFEIIRQVVTSSSVDRKVILGLISGYVSLGLIGFFIFLSIEMAHPNSIYGLTGLGDDQRAIFDQIMYFSYITLLTIGYGDLLPVTALAQKASILIGIMGQLYLTIITATIVGKFIGQWSNKRDSKNPKDKISDNG